MKPINGYDNAPAFDGEFQRITAGGHICKIVEAKVEIYNGTERLVLGLDIDEGSEFDGMYRKQFEDRKATRPDARWGCIFRQSTVDNAGKCSGYFKGLMKSIEESNSGYRWNWDEKSLRGLKVGMIFREEEYEDNMGTVRVSCKPFAARSVQRIKDGVPVPDIRRLNNSTAAAAALGAPAGAVEVVDETLPF